MLPRGTIFTLEPDKYENHKELAAWFDRHPAWVAVGETEPPLAIQPVEPKQPEDLGLFPHQAAVIAALRNSRGQP